MNEQDVRTRIAVISSTNGYKFDLDEAYDEVIDLVQDDILDKVSITSIEFIDAGEEHRWLVTYEETEKRNDPFLVIALISLALNVAFLMERVL